MGGTFVFLHGTGKQDHEKNETRVKAQIAACEPLANMEVINISWGELAPPQADLATVLPGLAQIDAEVDLSEAFENFARDLLVESGQSDLPQTEGLIKDWALRKLTDKIEEYRYPLTKILADFLQNVFYYFRIGDEIRDLVRTKIASANQDDRVVVAGHSLGGIIALDVLGDPEYDQSVDLLVTAGSQGPLFRALGASPTLKWSGKPAWLNIYNPRDPLSFLAGNVFPGARDEPVEDPENLPDAHTKYFDRPVTYDLIAAQLGAP